MRNKSADILYCGVNKNKIFTAKPLLNEDNLKYFFNWMQERYKIHLKKDIEGKNPPWTEDKILQKYKFTNVRREHDRESKWLIENVCNNDRLNYESKILHIILFRLFNKSETMKIIGLLDWGNLDMENIRKSVQLHREKNNEFVYFSNAFYTSGPKKAANSNMPGEKDMVIKVISLVENYRNQRIVEKIISAKSAKDVFDVLKALRGIGDFLAYQIFVDLTYLKDFPFSENEFVVAGPGCKKGLNLIFKDLSGMNYEEALFWLRDNQEKILSKLGYNPKELFSDLPEEERYLSVMSLENCMCEISKYIRTLKEEGRPRIKYKPKP